MTFETKFIFSSSLYLPSCLNDIQNLKSFLDYIALKNTLSQCNYANFVYARNIFFKYFSNSFSRKHIKASNVRIEYCIQIALHSVKCPLTLETSKTNIFTKFNVSFIKTKFYFHLLLLIQEIFSDSFYCIHTSFFFKSGYKILECH